MTDQDKLEWLKGKSAYATRNIRKKYINQHSEVILADYNGWIARLLVINTGLLDFERISVEISAWIDHPRSGKDKTDKANASR